MAIDGITGNGATMTLSGFTMAIRVLNLPEESVQDVDFSHLGDNDAKWKPGDLIEHGALEFEGIFNPKLAMPAFGPAASITVTLPKMVAASVAAATLIGTGYVNMRKYPDLSNNTPAIVRGRIKYDGDTPPAFTIEA